MNTEDVWFTGDHHFFHYNIIRYTNRPFEDEREMNRNLIRNYKNSEVQEESEVFFLGDLMLGGPRHKHSLEGVMDGLPGRKHLIVGNHDRLSVRDYTDVGFATVHSFLEFHFPMNLPMESAPGVTKEEDVVLNMVHDPAAAQNPNGMYLTGHVHQKWKKQKNCVNVGVDVWDYSPVRLETVMKLFNG